MIQAELRKRRRGDGTLGFGDVLRLARDGLRDQPQLAEDRRARRSKSCWSTNSKTRAACSAICCCCCASNRARSRAASRAACRRRPTSARAAWSSSAIASNRSTRSAAPRSRCLLSSRPSSPASPAARQLELRGVAASAAPVAEFHTLTENYRSSARHSASGQRDRRDATSVNTPSAPSRFVTRRRSPGRCRRFTRASRTAGHLGRGRRQAPEEFRRAGRACATPRARCAARSLLPACVRARRAHGHAFFGHRAAQRADAPPCRSWSSRSTGSTCRSSSLAARCTRRPRCAICSRRCGCRSTLGIATRSPSWRAVRSAGSAIAPWPSCPRRGAASTRLAIGKRARVSDPQRARGAEHAARATARARAGRAAPVAARRAVA